RHTIRSERLTLTADSYTTDKRGALGRAARLAAHAMAPAREASPRSAGVNRRCPAAPDFTPRRGGNAAAAHRAAPGRRLVGPRCPPSRRRPAERFPWPGAAARRDSGPG